MQKYKCHKVVEAGKITELTPTTVSFDPVKTGVISWTPPNGWMEKHIPEVGGYIVEYDDGYRSYSPAEAFEAGYSPEPENELGFDFGEAINLMKRHGKFVARKGWNGKGMFLYFVAGTSVDVKDLRGRCAEAVKFIGPEYHYQQICGHIDMMAADGSCVIGWLASQTDMLALDWVVVS